MTVEPSPGDRLFWRLFALASISHLVARPPWDVEDPWLRSSAWLLVIAATALLIRPDTRTTRFIYCLTVVGSFVAETPGASNHWALAALVALALLLSGDARTGRASMWPVYVLIVAYGFSAFAKLNSDFFDPGASCSVELAGSALSVVGLGPPTGLAAASLPWIAAAIELSVFGLLVFPRTRRVGAVLGMAFHLLLVLDLPNRFYDFTGVLMPLFMLAAGSGNGAASELGRATERLPRLAGGVGAIGAGTVALMAVEAPGTVFVLARVAFVIVWFTIMGVIFATSLRTLRTVGATATPVKTVGHLALIAVVLTALNGTTPYLEVKTTFGFNMFSNLRTEAGLTNHLLVPGTRPSPRFDDLVEVIESDDEALASYSGSGFLLPLESLRAYTSRHPDVGLVYREDGVVIDADPRPPGSALDEPVPWLRERFGFLRAVDEQDPKRCESSFLPLS